MPYSIVTMSRGDSARLDEWVSYHARLGFDDFTIVLDAPVDDSEAVIKAAADAHGVHAEVMVREPVGDYYDGLDTAERWKRILQWRKDNAEEIADSGLPINDPISWRQHHHLTSILDDYSHRGDGWLALIDVDEFIVVGSAMHIQQITDAANAPRLRFLNFNVDTSGHDPSRPVLSQHNMRWARADIEAHGNGWQNRVKSMVRYDSCAPLASVHPISRGNYEIVSPDVARLLHFRVPLQGLPIPYSVKDLDALRV